MRNFFKKIMYINFTKVLNRLILSLFFEKKYLTGKYFDQKRYGFVWAWKAVPRSFLLRIRGIKWPVGHGVFLSNGENIIFDNSSLNIFQLPGCYFQNHSAKIFIGKNVHIAPNVGIITSNHNLENPDERLPGKNVMIGDDCWIGMNAVILPGVILGPHTVVGAGAIVTHSFEQGYCVIAGNPAKMIRKMHLGDSIARN